ncbi:hypothetical protein EJ05DRAFT_346926 [Pseudovirgaria hyperparasitica]|uniref:Btz domain-containing protein n=1 Tax=Pseudovirgaria hyperparasitica TaxID=470096 RepID=A0A6A6W7X6_9PEZI|nr:uncharacterized protein EJ05DRAFT_346926 [Pseudovirgaria hyperparasitica]KAF2758309.1 hypothetical protein EJ05DRAFT_346926 [Pseudovirgaria hyperparasitica]
MKMAAQRRRNIVQRRRRNEEEGDDEASVVTDHNDDSQSEGSIQSDQDADADASDLSDTETPGPLNDSEIHRKPQSRQQRSDNIRSGQNEILTGENGDKFFPQSTDTVVMMNGLNLSESVAKDEGVDFETLNRKRHAVPTHPVIVTSKQETPAERRRREHEEYRRKKEDDPAFIPNRGPFFMHDQRASGPGANGFRSIARGRGRGRGGVGAPFASHNDVAPPDETLSGPWAHDLHQSLLDQDGRAQLSINPTYPSFSNTQSAVRKAIPAPSRPNLAQSFSTTREIAKALIRVSLPGMEVPVNFADVPLKLYARLPNHRPPLRRDKPVRISLPNHPPRYIFPSTERSFIFIPRAMRPNQQGFGRGRGRGIGSMGGFSSRRTSVYAGSVNSPSVAMSRRSSLAREFPRDGIISPTGSVVSRPPGSSDMVKPIVRLPPGQTQASAFGHATPIVNIPPPSTYPLPQRPAFRENSAGLPMYQPRPQKAVSMAGIESPVNVFAAPLQQEQLPFHQQVPPQLNGQGPPDQTQQYPPHTRQLSYPSQPSTGTPLSHIPERAIHAQPFQPYQQSGYPMPNGYAPGYFYAPSNPPQGQYPTVTPSGMVPMYMQGGQSGTYMLPAGPASVSVPVTNTTQSQASMVAHEANGTVYYYDPFSVYTATAMEGYAPTSYAVPGIGGMMTPSPDGYHYPQMQPGGTVYYG